MYGRPSSTSFEVHSRDSDHNGGGGDGSGSGSGSGNTVAIIEAATGNGTVDFVALVGSSQSLS